PSAKFALVLSARCRYGPQTPFVPDLTPRACMSKASLLTPAHGRLPVLLILSVCLLAPCALRAESLEANSSLGLWDLDLARDALVAPVAAMPTGRGQRVRLFRIAPGFLSDPIGLQDEDSGLPGVPSMPGSNLPSAPGQADNGPEW